MASVHTASRTNEKAAALKDPKTVFSGCRGRSNADIKMSKQAGEACLASSECMCSNCFRGHCKETGMEPGDLCSPTCKEQCGKGMRCDGRRYRCVPPQEEQIEGCYGKLQCTKDEYCDERICRTRIRIGQECKKSESWLGEQCIDGATCYTGDGQEQTGTCRKLCYTEITPNGCAHGQKCQSTGGLLGVCLGEEKPVEKPKEEPKLVEKPKEEPTPEEEEETEEEEEGGKPKKKRSGKKKRPPPVIAPALPVTPPVAEQIPWSKQLGLPDMSNRELAIYGSIAGVVLLVLIVVIVSIVVSCKRKRQRRREKEEAGKSPELPSDMDLPSYQDVQMQSPAAVLNQQQHELVDLKGAGEKKEPLSDRKL